MPEDVRGTIRCSADTLITLAVVHDSSRSYIALHTPSTAGLVLYSTHKQTDVEKNMVLTLREDSESDPQQNQDNTDLCGKIRYQTMSTPERTQEIVPFVLPQ